MLDVQKGSSRNCGFTLLEILVALAVSGVAVALFISLFSATVSLAKTNQNEIVAASLAEEQLELLRRDPRQVIWTLNAPPGELASLEPAMQNVGQMFSPPTVPPQNATQQKNLYSRFEWRAYARVPSPDDAHIELIMAVHWKEAGRLKSLVLSSAIPKRLVVAAAAPGVQQ